MDAQRRQYLTKKETSKIIKVWGENVDQLRGTHKNHHIYKEMCVELAKRYQIDLSPGELRNRINNLLKKFRAEVKRTEMTGEFSKWDFYPRIYVIDQVLKNNKIKRLAEENSLYENNSNVSGFSPITNSPMEMKIKIIPQSRGASPDLSPDLTPEHSNEQSPEQSPIPSPVPSPVPSPSPSPSRKVSPLTSPAGSADQEREPSPCPSNEDWNVPSAESTPPGSPHQTKGRPITILQKRDPLETLLELASNEQQIMSGFVTKSLENDERLLSLLEENNQLLAALITKLR